MPSAIPDNELVLAIDPGNVESAFCKLKGKIIYETQKIPNELMLGVLENTQYDHVAIEMIASYGMAVGASVFDTCVFIGRIIQCSKTTPTLIARIQVKSHICHSGKAKDANIRQALIDLFGPPGKKSAPGPTFGISADMWSALAIAETFRSGDYTPYTLSADKPENK